MRARLTSDNRLTLPERVLAEVGWAQVFEVAVQDGRIHLTPVRGTAGDVVRASLAELGLGPQDIEDAVDWARSGRPRRA